MIGCDTNMSNGKIKAEILLQHWTGYQQELEIKGNLISMESEPLGLFGRKTTLVIENDGNLYVEHKNARCKPIPNEALDCFKEATNQVARESNNMSVKIKKQPKEITLEELKQSEEFERVTIYIDEDKKHEIENKYGVHYGFMPRMSFEIADFDFKEFYVAIEDGNFKRIPYEIIEKIEVVEK